MTVVLQKTNHDIVLHTSTDIPIIKLPAAATSIAISNHNTLDSAPAGSVVGTLSAVFPNASPAGVVYTLVNSAGGKYALNASNQITVAAPLIVTTDTIIVRVIQSGKYAPYSQSISINVAFEQAPTSINFTPLSTLNDQNSTAGVVVGTATATDASNTYQWTLIDDADGAFSIDSKSGVVRIVSSLTAQTYHITIQVADGIKSFSLAFPITVTQVQPGPLNVAFSLTNAKSSALTNPVVSMAHYFAAGDVPADTKLALTVNNTPVAIQQAQETYHSDGSLWGATLRFTSPDTFDPNGGANQTRAGYTLTSVPGHPNRTGMTLADLVANTDFKMEYSGFDCGADTYVVSLNEIAAKFTAFPWLNKFTVAAGGATAGSITLPLTSVAHISLGQLVTGPGLAASTLVQAINTSAKTIQLSAATTAAITGGSTIQIDNPLGGIDIINTGSECFEVVAWSFLKVVGGANDGLYHRWIKCKLYITAWSPTGPFEIYPYTMMANVFGPVAGGSLGAPVHQPSRMTCTAVLKNGNNVLQHYGGLNDSRCFTADPTMFDITTGRFNPPASQTWLHPQAGGIGVAFQADAGSTLPGKIQPLQPYWLISSVYRFAYLMDARAYVTNQGTAWVSGATVRAGHPSSSGVAVTGSLYASTSAASGGGGLYYTPTGGVAGTVTPSGDGPVSDGSITDWVRASTSINPPGSGTFTVYPVVTVYGSTGWVGATSTAEPVWDPGTSGVAVRPHLMPSMDFVYLTQKTRILPPFANGVTTYPRASFNTHDRGITGSWDVFSIGQPQPFGAGGSYWDVGNYGDDPGDERVGYIATTSAWLLYQQSDYRCDQMARSFALGWADYMIHIEDQAAGLPVVVNAGPTKTLGGPSYPGMGVIGPSFGVQSPQQMYALPVPGSPDWCGHMIPYGPLLDDSHSPMPWIIPYIRTGHRIFLDMGIHEAVTMTGGGGTRGGTTGTTVPYYGVLTGVGHQLRGVGWLLRTGSMAEVIAPTSHPVKAMLTDMVDDSGSFLAEYYSSSHQSAAQMGLGMMDNGSFRVAYNAGPAPITVVTTTDAASGSTDLTFADVSGIAVGQFVAYGTPGVPDGTTVMQVDGTSNVVTLNNALSAAIASGSTIAFCVASGLSGFTVTADAPPGSQTISVYSKGSTNLFSLANLVTGAHVVSTVSAIPANTTAISIGASSMTLSAPITGTIPAGTVLVLADNWLNKTWMYGYAWMAIAMVAWREQIEQRRPTYYSFLENYARNWMVDLFDVDVGGSMYYVGAYQEYIGPGPDPLATYSGPAQLLAANHGPAPYPTTGWPTSYATGLPGWPWDSGAYTTIWAASMAIGAAAGVTGCAKLYGRWQSRITTAPSTGIVFAGQNISYYSDGDAAAYMTYCFAPPSGS